MTFRLKRIHDPVARDDGYRVLVDRVRPRGLRKWFRHDPARWDEFRHRYHTELDDRPERVAELRDRASRGAVTLCYAARDREHNNAVALKGYLEQSP